MDDLVRWLGEQLDEDERTVTRAQTPEVTKSETPETWVAAPIDKDPDSGWQVLHHALRIIPSGEPTVDTYTVVTDGQVARGADRPVGLDRFMAEYIAAHDPARVLREIEVKRQIAELHVPEWVNTGGNGRSSYFCAGCDGELLPCRTLRLLAMPYAHRVGYRAEWAPEV